MHTLSRRVTFSLLAVVGLIMATFAVVFAVHKVTARVPKRLLDLFHINTEASAPAWFNAALLLCAGLLAVALAVSAPRLERRAWVVLAVLFGYLSLDEAAALHETLAYGVQRLGWLDSGSFLWVVPGAIVALTGVLIVLGSCRRLPPPVRGRLLIALGVYGVGALGIEFVTGAVLRGYGHLAVVDAVVHPALQIAEEAIEMIACILAIRALIRLIEAEPQRLRRAPVTLVEPSSDARSDAG